MRVSQFLVVALGAAAAACSAIGIGGPTHHKNLLVQHYAAECTSPSGSPGPCLLVKEPGDVSFDFRSGIEGFSYEWGFTYELNVDESPADNPPTPATALHTVLREQVSRTRVQPGTRFDLVLTGGAVSEVSPGRYQLAQWPAFVCNAGVDCVQLASRLAAGKKVHFQFAHPAVATDPLIVMQWDECAGAAAGVFVCNP